MGRTTGIYPTQDGRFDVDRTYKRTRLRQRGFESFEHAESWLIRQLDALRKEFVHGTRAARNFEEAAVYYIELFANKRSLESEIFHLKAVMPFIGQLALDQIHNGTLKPFIDARKEAGRKNKTINLSLGIVRRILNLCARDWRDERGLTWLQTAPLITLLPLTDQRAPRPIMWEEQRRLLPCLADHTAAMALFTLNTGCRDDVVCNLQWAWEVPVPQLGVSVFLVPGEHVKANEEKRSERVLVLNSVAQKVIEQRRGIHSTHVFTFRGKPIDGVSNTAWQNGRKKAGMGDLHFHDLRHTVGMRLREAGVGESTRSAVLWHSNRDITGHYSMAQIVEIFEALEKIKDETNRWNISLESLKREAQITQKLPSGFSERQTG